VGWLWNAQNFLLLRTSTTKGFYLELFREPVVHGGRLPMHASRMQIRGDQTAFVVEFLYLSLVFCQLSSIIFGRQGVALFPQVSPF
jgi:hypothetical protein